MTETEVKTNLSRALANAEAWALVLTAFEQPHAGEMTHRMPMPPILKAEGGAEYMTYRMAGQIVAGIREAVAREAMDPIPCPLPEPECDPVPEANGEEIQVLDCGEFPKEAAAVLDAVAEPESA